MKKIVFNIEMCIIIIALLFSTAYAYLEDDTKKEEKAKTIIDKTYPNDSPIIEMNARLSEIDYYQQQLFRSGKGLGADTVLKDKETQPEES